MWVWIWLCVRFVCCWFFWTHRMWCGATVVLSRRCVFNVFMFVFVFVCVLCVRLVPFKRYHELYIFLRTQFSIKMLTSLVHAPISQSQKHFRDYLNRYWVWNLEKLKTEIQIIYKNSDRERSKERGREHIHFWVIKSGVNRHLNVMSPPLLPPPPKPQQPPPPTVYYAWIAWCIEYWRRNLLIRL